MSPCECANIYINFYCVHKLKIEAAPSIGLVGKFYISKKFHQLVDLMSLILPHDVNCFYLESFFPLGVGMT